MVRPVTDQDTGLRVLSEPVEEAAGVQAQTIDIVAIHGIGAHPDDTWSKNVDTNDAPRYVNWLTEPNMLPQVAPNARILRYGYESAWFGKNAISQKTTTVANRFLTALERERQDSPFRPLIFIAHCFGGLVILKTLLEARNNKEEWQGIFDSTTGLIFFGTPFRGAEGMKQSEMLEAARREYADDEVQASVLHILEPGNEFLQDLVDQFGKTRSLPNKAQVACFFELKPTNVGAIVGGQARTRFVVNESSGCLDLSDSTKKYSVARTHFDMNKFGTPNEEDFLTVCDVIKRIVKATPELMIARSQFNEALSTHISAVSVNPFVGRNDLWRDAVAGMSDEDKRNINFNEPDKRHILSDLRELVTQSKQDCVKKRWRYTRPSGETVILVDLFGKIAKWIDLFEQIKDTVLQGNQDYAALPWAAVRFLFQIAVKDINSYAFVIESTTHIAEMICRYTIFESVYLQSTYPAANEFKKALLEFYTAVMIYLSKAKSCFEQKSAAQSDIGFYYDVIVHAEETVEHVSGRVGIQERINHRLNLKKLFEHINGPIERMRADLGSIKDDFESSKRTGILLWISPEPYIQHHEQAKREVLPGTGQWLLSHPVFNRWKKESVSTILWLHGIPGSGKSKLVSIVIEDAKRAFHNGQSPAPVFFYCSRNTAEPARSNPDAIVASIARQLSSLQPGYALLPPTVAAYKKRETVGFASGSLGIDESCALIVQLSEQYPMTTIVIDALDECDPERRADLLETLESILQESTSLVKIFVSSRRDRDIVLHLRDYPNLELSSDKNKDDISSFVITETSNLIKRKKLLALSTNKEKLKIEIIEQVRKNADGMFRWASLQLQSLCSLWTDEAIRERLGRLPPKLEELYLELYKKLTATSANADREVTIRAFSWLLCAQRTLTSDEFLAALSTTPGRQFNKLTIEHILDICSNMVVFDPTLDTFRFAHLSVREFLEKRPEYTREATNALAAETCLLDVLSAAGNPETRRFLSNYRQDSSNPTLSHDLGRYTTIYWAPHCQLAAHLRTDGVLKDLLHFISNKSDLRSAIGVWASRIKGRFDDYSIEWELRERLKDTEAQEGITLFVASCFDLQEIVRIRENFRDNIVNSQGRTLLHVAVTHGSCDVVSILIKDKFTTIAEEVVKAAAGNRRSGKEVMLVLLEQRGADVVITEEVVKVAAGNRSSGREVMLVLLEHRGADVITEEVLKAAAGNEYNGKEVMLVLLEQRGADVVITEEVVKVAAGNGREVMLVLLEQRGADVVITEEVLKVAAGNGSSGREVMLVLLEHRGADVVITEEVLKAAAGNEYNGKEVMLVLLEHRGADVVITEEVVKAAAGNEYNGKEVMLVLLEQRGADVVITEEVVKAAAGNGRNGKEVMLVLLEQRGADVVITEEVVKIIASQFGEEVILVLLEQRGVDVVITEEVLKAAAGNRSSGREVMLVLLEQRGVDVVITEEVVKAAAGNWWSGKEVMLVLLEQRGADVVITEEVLKVAAGNGSSGREVILVLLEHRGADVVITEEVLKAAAGNGREVMLVLLEQRGVDVVITEEVMKAAAGNGRNGKEVMLVLLEHRGADVVITEEVMKAAAGNGREVMLVLLEHRGADVVITEEVVKIIASQFGEEVMLVLLEQRGADVVITEEVVKAAAGNRRSGKEVMLVLLEQRGADVVITEEVVKAAAGNMLSGKEVMLVLLEQRGADVVITEEVLKAAVGNVFSGKEVMLVLLEQRGADVVITEEVVKAAAGNILRGKEVMLVLLEQRGADVVITEEVMKAAAGNGREVMLVLLEQRGADVVITEEVVKAAAGNGYNGKEVILVLLEQRGADVVITEEVVKAAAGNVFSGKEVMLVLLEQRGADVVITKEVVKTIASRFGEEVMLVLEQRGADVVITEEVVKAIASQFGEEVMLVLLEQRGADVVITEEVVKAAAGNWWSGKEVMLVLLEHRGADVVITEEVLKAAAGNVFSGKEVMLVLLEQRGADVVITEEVVKAAVGNGYNGKEVMLVLLEQRGADVVITEEVVKAAAGNILRGKEVMLVLLEHRGADVVITEEVVKTIVSRFGEEVMMVFERGAAAATCGLEGVLKTISQDFAF